MSYLKNIKTKMVIFKCLVLMYKIRVMTVSSRVNPGKMLITSIFANYSFF